MLILGAYFGRDDVTDDVIIENSECSENFRNCISVTLSQRFGQIFSCFAVRTKYVHLMTKYTPPLYRRRVKIDLDSQVLRFLSGLTYSYYRGVNRSFEKCTRTRGFQVLWISERVLRVSGSFKSFWECLGV